MAAGVRRDRQPNGHTNARHTVHPPRPDTDLVFYSDDRRRSYHLSPARLRGVDEAAITELFRPILLTMDSEDYRWYTDEDRINADLAAHWQAVNELKTAVGDEMFDQQH